MSTSSIIVLTVLQGNDPVSLVPLQHLLEPHTQTLVHLWMSIWLTTALVLLSHIYRTWRNTSNN